MSTMRRNPRKRVLQQETPPKCSSRNFPSSIATVKSNNSESEFTTSGGGGGGNSPQNSTTTEGQSIRSEKRVRTIVEDDEDYRSIRAKRFAELSTEELIRKCKHLRFDEEEHAYTEINKMLKKLHFERQASSSTASTQQRSTG